MTTSTTGGVFRYFVKDHLGNNRVVNNGNTVYQRTHYYPFGGFFADQGTNSSLQPYKYNGKELERMHGLDLYDYGARQYDPIVPMFTQQDPLAEKYYHLSPYAYCANNPVNAIDIDGEKVQLVVRQLNPFIPISIAAHTFLIVSHEGKHPISYTYGPHGAIGGKLERTSYNYDNEIREGKKTEVDYQIIDVPIPENLSEEEFDSNIHEAAKQFDGNTEVNYNILTFSDRTANCNTSTTTLLYKAGVSKETIKELKKEIKGNAYGFGQTRPWTREERQKLEEDIDNSNKFLGL